MYSQQRLAKHIEIDRLSNYLKKIEEVIDNAQIIPDIGISTGMVFAFEYVPVINLILKSYGWKITERKNCINDWVVPVTERRKFLGLF